MIVRRALWGLYVTGIPKIPVTDINFDVQCCKSCNINALRDLGRGGKQDPPHWSGHLSEARRLSPERRAFFVECHRGVWMPQREPRLTTYRHRSMRLHAAVIG